MRDMAARPFGVMLIPSEFQVEDRLWDAATAALEQDGLDRGEPQRSLVAALDAAGIPCLDLLPQLLDTAPLADGDRHLYRPCDTHFSVRGNQLAAEALAPFVRTLIQR